LNLSASSGSQTSKFEDLKAEKVTATPVVVPDIKVVGETETYQHASSGSGIRLKI